jgi:predicted unusual protein kinase regulating ubiquinone biosynthesis (AarF/ABC1/UbiB family)
VLSSRR